jgi:hypothetical protein
MKNVWRKKNTKDALRKFKEDDNESRMEYWESRRAHERTVENRRYMW